MERKNGGNAHRQREHANSTLNVCSPKTQILLAIKSFFALTFSGLSCYACYYQPSARKGAITKMNKTLNDLNSILFCKNVYMYS